jgi:hypothetical protein
LSFLAIAIIGTVMKSSRRKAGIITFKFIEISPLDNDPHERDSPLDADG